MADKTRTHVKSATYLLEKFPCVAVLGARQVGKSTLLRQILPRAPLFDLERSSHFDRISADPEFFLAENQPPIILDEAQHYPPLFEALRVAIDENRRCRGQYLLSGSSSPELLRSLTETLAGRVVIMELSGFHLEEAWGGEPSPLYRAIENGDLALLRKLESLRSAEEVRTSCLCGGYPEPFLGREDPRFFDLWMENYFRTYIDRDVRRLFPGLRMESFRRFIRMLAVSSGEFINKSNLARSLDVSQPTIRSYLEITEGTFLWRSIPSFQRNPKKRVLRMPKGHLRDSGLVTHLLNIHSIEDMIAHPQFGNLWEGFVAEQLIQGLGIRLATFRHYFYRTKDQAEIDLVLEGRFGIIPVEIKSGIKVNARSLRTLRSFVEEFDCPFGLLINQAQEPANLTPKIVQIPATCL